MVGIPPLTYQILSNGVQPQKVGLLAYKPVVKSLLAYKPVVKSPMANKPDARSPLAYQISDWLLSPPQQCEPLRYGRVNTRSLDPPCSRARFCSILFFLMTKIVS